MRKLKQAPATLPFLVFSLILSLERSLSTRERGKRERGNVFSLILSLERSLSTRERGKRERGKQEKKESEMEGKAGKKKREE